MVEAAEIPVVNKTSTHRTAGNSTYTSNTKRLMPDLTGRATNRSPVFKLTKPRLPVNRLQRAVKREDNG